jgi:hypothetical protein
MNIMTNNNNNKKYSMVYIRKNLAYRDDDQYVVVRVTEDEVDSVKITNRQQG